MSASTFIQLIFDGIAIGLVFVFMAAGFNLILSVTNIFFITFGMFYAIGAYTTWFLVAQMGLPFFVGVALATLATALGGAVLYLLVMRRLRTNEQALLSYLIASIMLVTLMTQFILLVFGTSPRGIPPLFGGHWRIAGVVVSQDRAAMILVSVAVLVSLHLFLRGTRIGRGMRALAFNPDVAALMGVNAERTFVTTFAVGLGLAGFAGGLMAPVFGIDIGMGQAGFVVLLVIMLGGVGSMVGSIASGVILGIVLAFAQFFVSAGVGQMIFFLVVGVFFYFRPGGLFGKPMEDPPAGVASLTSAKMHLKGKRSWIAAGTAVIVLLALPLVVHNAYYMHLIILMTVFSVMGMTFTFGMRSGMINVAAASFWGIGAYSTGILMVNDGLNFWTALPITLAISFILALALGAVICRFAGMSGMMFGIVFSSIVPLLFGTLKIFGRYSGFTGIPAVSDLGPIHFGSKASYYYLLLAFSFISLAIMLGFTKAWTGRSWLGLASSPKLAQSVGIDPFGYRLINFVIMSMIPALLGTVYACYLGAIQPITFGPFVGINFQVVAFLGGLGYLVAGPIVGALLMTLVPETLRAAGNLEPVITAVIIILVVMFLPGGILGSVDRWIVARVQGVRRSRTTAAESEPLLVPEEAGPGSTSWGTTPGEEGVS